MMHSVNIGPRGHLVAALATLDGVLLIASEPEPEPIPIVPADCFDLFDFLEDVTILKYRPPTHMPDAVPGDGATQETLKSTRPVCHLPGWPVSERGPPHHRNLLF